MMEVRSLVKYFGKLKVLDQVSLTCHKGHTIGLIGPNGSGKTTLIKCILGLVFPTSGTIALDGKEILRDFIYRTKIGYMPQIGRYPENMTVQHVFKMLRDVRGLKATASDEQLVYDFGLDRIMSKRMHTLSGGTRQKVSAALAFLFKPEILILDEPTAGLDPVSAEFLKKKITECSKEGRLVLLTSHLLSDLDELVTEVMYLEAGRLRFHKPIEQLRSETGEEKLSRAIAFVMKNNSANS